MQISKFVIRTSGRRTMRRCLRKYGLQASTHKNLQRRGTEQNIHFWFGSAIHFAMEDYFGHNKFGTPQRAFQAYYAAFPKAERPEGSDSHYSLGLEMLDYFVSWYALKNQELRFETVWLDENRQEVKPGTPGAEPLIEESFLLDLNFPVWIRKDTGEIIANDESQLDSLVGVHFDPETSSYYLWDSVEDDAFGNPVTQKIEIVQIPIMYHGTMDRVVRDVHGRWWIMDWKTAKSADTNKLDTDDQISAYLWAAEQHFQRPIHGFIYVQLTKEAPKGLKRLKDGSLSVDQKQKTTAALAKQSIVDVYGALTSAPPKIVAYYNWLLANEQPEGDKFIRWDKVYRTRDAKISTYYHIQGELQMITRPNMYLFPNPTRDCIWDCPFRDACLMMDNGQAAEAEKWLDLYFEPRPREEDGNIDSWRVNIPWPGTPQGEVLENTIRSIEEEANMVLNIIFGGSENE